MKTLQVLGEVVLVLCYFGFVQEMERQWHSYNTWGRKEALIIQYFQGHKGIYSVC